MFFDPIDFPFIRDLEACWLDIRREFESLRPERLVQWPERNIYQGSWEVLAFYALGERFEVNCNLCPRTARAVESVPGMISAAFSVLAPGAQIRPHVGYTASVLRCHLGLIVPEECALRVGDETRAWEEGKCIIFDDTVLHSAWNKSERQRVVLLIDFQRGERPFDRASSAEAMAAVELLRQAGPVQ